LSSIVAVESSDADRSDLSGGIDCGWSGAPEQAASTLSLPHGFYAFRSVRVTVDAELARYLSLAQRFARHVSPLTTTVCTHPSDQELWVGVRKLNF
jgi:hypothetical protein